MPSVRTRLSGLLSAFTMSGATTGSVKAPTGVQLETLAGVKKDLTAIESDLKRK